MVSDAPHRKRILFFAETVTLAHLARPVALLRSLPLDYEIGLACDSRYDHLLTNLPARRFPLETIPSATFLAALAKGAPIYSSQVFRNCVRDDLRVIQEFQPDVIVGDFRLSLSVSARVARVPYITITNAYWSPYARQKWPVPELPLTRLFGVPIAQRLFGMARPLAFASHARPLNRVRREYGLPSLGPDLRRTYTDADVTLYADVPELFPTFDLPPNHHYLGPILWSPEIPAPDWWDQVPHDQPVIYVTLGSSGQSRLLQATLEALQDLPASVLASTAGAPLPERIPENAFVSKYLPGEAAAERAGLVICNGGSLTTQQALAVGKPVIGIASNLDQFLNMQAICQAGAGVLVRAGNAKVESLRSAARLVSDPSYTEQARLIADGFRHYKLGELFTIRISEAGLTPLQATGPRIPCAT